MLPLNKLIEKLNYARSPYYRSKIDDFEPETAHLFRAAKNLDVDGTVDGIYVFKTSSNIETKILAAQPAVFVATANTEKAANEIHRLLWNLSHAPFIIIRLPHQIRVYTGFSFDRESENEGWLASVEADRFEQISTLLADLSAEAIDSGRIWESTYAQQLNPNQRVDSHLLRNLQQLGEALKKSGLREETAHALIGKYVYISYLRDREILTDTWLAEQDIAPQQVFSQDATILSLEKLVTALEARFNGKIFPIDFSEERNHSLEDKHVSWVASVFSGSEIVESAPNVVQQLHLPFQAYDFRYIPVETLSSIYEQFIDKRKEKGAIYTPEFLADYLLSEVEWAKPLEPGGKILDPACGSGVFLVLAYRRMIEKEAVRLGRRLTPQELKSILTECIYGVERERDACYVTEFSLILTLLHYVEPPDLVKIDFKFPDLHNSRIFESDFFDLNSDESDAQFWQQNLKFDWIVGNPPWTSKLNPQEDKFALKWIKSSKRPVSGQRVAEAFSWLVMDLLKPEGIVGLLLPATSLYDLNSEKYRRKFFAEHDVLRITNFSNLRDYLFGKGKSDVLPAATFIYRPAVDKDNRPEIIHYGPFAINQLTKTQRRPWTITINENEIQTVSTSEAESGETSVWKYALWGSYLDKDAIERIEFLLPHTLEEMQDRHNWSFHQGSELKDVSKSSDKLEYIPWLKGKKRLNTEQIGNSPMQFSIEPHILERIPDEMCYIRVQGGKKGLNTTWAPHILISAMWQRYIIYSDKDFVIPPRQMAIAAPKDSSPDSGEYLHALTIYLRSSLVAYYLFFHVPEWGVSRRAKRVATTAVRKIRTPDFTYEQAKELARFHEDLVKREREEVQRCIAELPGKQQHRLDFKNGGSYQDAHHDMWEYLASLSRAARKVLTSLLSGFHEQVQREIDEEIFNLLNIPDDIRLLVREFIETRLPLDKASTTQEAVRKPEKQELLAYACELQAELDAFAMGTAFHKVNMTNSNELIECTVEIMQNGSFIPVEENIVADGTIAKERLLSELSENLREQVSQWVYVQRGLRLFDGPRTYIYKPPRLINWTRTQAMRDAGDIIGQVIAEAGEK